MIEAKHIFILAIALIAGVFLFFWAFRLMKTRQLILDTPRSKIRSMAMGLVEIHAKAQAKKATLTAPFSQDSCLYYRYEIEEYRKHVSHGKNGTKVRYSWDMIARGDKRATFLAIDETGVVEVDPEGAGINAPLKAAFEQKVGLFGSIGNFIRDLQSFDLGSKRSLNVSQLQLTPLAIENDKKKLRKSFGTRVGDRRYYEYRIDAGDELFVLGTAKNGGDSSAAYIAKGENEKTFIISTKSEKEMTKNLAWQMLASFIGSLVCLLGFVALLAHLL